jgi:hypothetical protein
MIEFAQDNPSAGYRQVKSYSIEAGIGEAVDAHYEDISPALEFFGAAATLMPVAGKSAVSDRFVSSHDEAVSGPALKIPSKAKDMDSWKKGDSLVYETEGGVAFGIGAGYLAAAVGGIYVANGEWNTTVEKLEDSKAYVKLTNTKLQTLDLYTGTIVTGVSKSFFQSSDDGFSYIFDLSKDDGVKAFEALIHGSAKDAQDFQLKKEPAVWLDMTRRGKRIGKSNGFFFGLPAMLNLTATSTDSYVATDARYHQDNSISHVEYGLYSNETDKDVFFSHSNRIRQFMGGDYINTDVHGVSKEGTFAFITISYANEKSDAGTIAKNIRDMIKQTGLRQALQAEAFSQAVSGFTQISLNATLSDAGTAALLAQAGYTTSSITNSVTETVNDYFNNQKDPDDLCSGGDVQVAQCRDSVISDTTGATKQMMKALGRMAAAKKSNDRKAFAQAYGDFGQAMLKNEFTFQLVQQMTQSAPMEITFSAEGETIFMVKKSILKGAVDSQGPRLN